MSKKISFLLRIIAGLALIFALFKFVPYNELLVIYRDSKKSYLLLAFLMYLASFCFAIIRWKYILRALRIKISLKEATYATFSSQFFNLFFPSFVAGDVFRSVSISRRHGDIKKVASSVLLDRFSGSSALALISIVAFIFGYSLIPHTQVYISLILIWGLIFLVALHIFSRRVFNFTTHALKRLRIHAKIKEFHEQLYFFKTKPSAFVTSLLCSVFIHAFTVISFIMAARAFGLATQAMHFFILVPIIMCVALLPITVAGIGTREAASVYFFSLVGISKSAGLGMSLLNLVFMLIAGIIGGIIYITLYHKWLEQKQG